MHSEITEDDFEDRFKPHRTSDGAYVQYEWGSREDQAAIVAAENERRLWTQVDGDNGEWCVSSGRHYVNRNYYIICDVPTSEGEEFTVTDPDSASLCCSTCDDPVSAGEQYAATPCGTFCGECGTKHLIECGVCRHQFT